MAASGTTVASFTVSTSRRTFTNWLGNSDSSVVVEDGAQLHRAGGGVDDVVEGAELADRELGLLRPVEHPHLQGGARLQAPAHLRASASSGMVNSTDIGCTWMMVQIGVASAMVT